MVTHLNGFRPKELPQAQIVTNLNIHRPATVWNVHNSKGLQTEKVQKVDFTTLWIRIFSCDQVAFRTLLSFCPSVCLVCLSVRPSDRPPVTPFSLYVPIIVPSWNFQELLPLTDVMSMQKVKVRGKGQRHRGHDPIQPFPDRNSSLNSHMAMKWCTKLDVASRSSVIFQGHTS